MRTTLDIDSDMLEAARGLAQRDRRPIGKVVSDLMRSSLMAARPDYRSRNGLPLLPVEPGSGVVTMELVNRLRDDFE